MQNTLATAWTNERSMPWFSLVQYNVYNIPFGVFRDIAVYENCPESASTKVKDPVPAFSCNTR